jgi:hypothetical protein
MHDLLLALTLLDCSGWLLGQEDGLPGCSDVGIDFLLAGYSDNTTAAGEETERELGLHLFPKLILVVELPNTNNWTN